VNFIEQDGEWKHQESVFLMLEFGELL